MKNPKTLALGSVRRVRNKLESAEERIGDPDITNIIVRYNRQFAKLEYERSNEEDFLPHC